MLTTPHPTIPGLDVPRPITIAYFPASELDYSGAAIENLRCAFKATINIGDSTRQNLLIPFTPLDPNFTVTCSTPEDCLAKYWKHLLSDTSGHNIVDQARIHFLERFTAKGVKF